MTTMLFLDWSELVRDIDQAEEEDMIDHFSNTYCHLSLIDRSLSILTRFSRPNTSTDTLFTPQAAASVGDSAYIKVISSFARFSDFGRVIQLHMWLRLQGLVYQISATRN